MRRRTSHRLLVLIAAGLLAVAMLTAVNWLFPRPVINYHLEGCSNERSPRL